ncbi:hypothetical protein Pla100_27140 [Neorhodopirellula pilleata]|uniref:Uncharacterized protein n=1 Tax=Neorhodopirellula pilleata TaxID=2714738 RepID=A0A5C6AA97_9BACT|nr:hypothetical protein Pla100_27140 [Neorhodopirellula pilleata]
MNSPLDRRHVFGQTHDRPRTGQPGTGQPATGRGTARIQLGRLLEPFASDDDFRTGGHSAEFACRFGFLDRSGVGSLDKLSGFLTACSQAANFSLSFGSGHVGWAFRGGKSEWKNCLGTQDYLATTSQWKGAGRILHSTDLEHKHL